MVTVSPSVMAWSAMALPPCESNVAVCSVAGDVESTIQCAYAVRSEVTQPTKLNLMPPVGSVHQWSKVYPARVGSAGSGVVDKKYTTSTGGGTGLPPCASNVTV